jgi:hypothetical protein
LLFKYSSIQIIPSIQIVPSIPRFPASQLENLGSPESRLPERDVLYCAVLYYTIPDIGFSLLAEFEFEFEFAFAFAFAFAWSSGFEKKEEEEGCLRNHLVFESGVFDQYIYI